MGRSKSTPYKKIPKKMENQTWNIQTPEGNFNEIVMLDSSLIRKKRPRVRKFWLYAYIDKELEEMREINKKLEKMKKEMIELDKELYKDIKKKLF